jgi:glycerol kinase
MARAALEAMAYGTADVAALMQKRSGIEFDVLRVDGGASVNDWLMQYQADVLGVPVERPDMVETTALGAAGLAGIAAGVWKRPEDFLGAREFARFEPGAGARLARESTRGWHRAVRAALSWARDSE